MSQIRGKGSAPKMKLHRFFYGMGFRYRLHVKELPGKPDLVLPSRHTFIFMHGCFWHRHEDGKLARLPKSKLNFWKTKLEANKERDLLHQRQLKDLGWRFLVVWECEMSNIQHVSVIVRGFLCKQEGGKNEIS
jgi:DNA mismatch endonuclease (patch repair protein)